MRSFWDMSLRTDDRAEAGLRGQPDDRLRLPVADLEEHDCPRAGAPGRPRAAGAG